ncbi:MAG: response regulator transcription factor [Chitinophagales bacterium]
MKIIVVDDDVIMLQAIKTMLTKEGYEVFATTDAEDALDTIQEEEFDLVISDIMMPYISGIELLSAIKKINKKIPIIIVSALDQKEVILTAFQEGAEDFVKKPISLSELLLRVKRVLGQG